MSFQAQSKPCPTCIYHPASPLNLPALEAQIADPHMKGFFTGFRICHHSERACCAGFWARHKNNFAAGQLAQRLGAVQFVTEDNLL